MCDVDWGPSSLELESAEAARILVWAWESFGEGLVATSSFQTQSLPLLHLIAQHAPDIPVLFLDTNYHFPETLEFRDLVVGRLGLRLRRVRPRMSHAEFLRREGELYARDPDRCCHLNKVEPLEQALEGAQAWISGIRRDQTQARGDIPVLSRQANGLLKVCPMATWTRQEVSDYIQVHQLPEHPLTQWGYKSVGCWPCTQPPEPGSDERSGRWAGLEKTECGLHCRYDSQEDLSA